jgi:hypothetical protein
MGKGFDFAIKLHGELRILKIEIIPKIQTVNSRSSQSNDTTSQQLKAILETRSFIVFNTFYQENVMS